jgi:hypothetical protein
MSELKNPSVGTTHNALETACRYKVNAASTIRIGCPTSGSRVVTAAVE